jgi:adhesin/invasin
MSIRFFSQWLIFTLILSLLTACGGGSDEPSGLVVGTGGPVGGGDTSTALSDGPQNVTVLTSAQEILPSGGSTTIKLTTYEAIDPNDDTPSYVLEPNVTIAIVIVSGEGRLENVPSRTNGHGEATFTVSHPGSGDVTINISGTGRYKGGFNMTLYFGGQVSAKVLTDGNVPADGTTPINIQVRARNAAGIGIPGMVVGLSFALNSSAVPTETFGYTDLNGEFITGITNTVPETTKVTPFAGGSAAGPLTLNFVASEVVSNLQDIDLVVKQNNVPANGTSFATMFVIARDASGAPVPHVPIRITSDSNTARLSIGEEYNWNYINGNTGNEGRFELNISNNVEETVEITATASSGEESKTISQTIIFSNPEDGGTTSGAQVAKIEMDDPINNNQPANGTDKVYLRGRVLDDAGNPIEKQIVSIIVSGGSAQFEEADSATTDKSGRFSVALTNTVAEHFTAKAVVGEINSNEVTVKFKAKPLVPEEGEEEEPTIQSIFLLANPTQQSANGSDQITLTAMVRDNTNTPVSAVPVTIEAASNTVIFDSSLVETGAGGTAVFQISNTVAETVSVTVKALGKSSTLTAKESLTFVKEEIDGNTGEIINIGSQVADLDINVMTNNQLANGTNAIQIDAIARDSNGRAVIGAPIFVQMSAGIAAKATPSKGETDEAGSFTTQITSTEAGDVAVTLAVDKTAIVSRPEMIKFTIPPPDPTTSTPTQLDLQVLNSPQPADGESKISLLVTPRDDENAPLSGVNIKLLTDVDESQLTIANTTGISNELGQFRTTITSNRAQTINVTAVVEGIADPNVRDTESIRFDPIDSGTIDLRVENDGQAADGESAISLIVTFRDASSNAVPDADVQLISDSSRVEIKGGKTNALGEFRTTVTATVPESINVTPVVKEIVGNQKTITFGPVDKNRIQLDIPNKEQPADGESAIVLIVTFRDAIGNTVPDADVQFIDDSVNLDISGGKTNALGEFRTTVTSTIEEQITVTPVVNGFVGQSDVITFRKVDSGNIDLQIQNDGQPADGTSPITLIVTFRDAGGQGIANAAVEFTDDSVNIDIAGGQTNALGEFRTTVSSSIAETINVTPIVKGIVGTAKTITFVQLGLPVVDFKPTIVNNNQPADGTTGVTVSVVARDNGGRAMSNVPVVVQLPTGSSAIANPAQGNTLEDGTFTTTITSPMAGEVAVTLSVDGTDISSVPVLVNFVTGGLPDTVNSVELLVENAPQPANGTSKITLITIPRDSRNTPVPGVEIQLIPDRDDIAIAEATGTTNALGEFRTTATTATDLTETLTETLVVNVTPVAQGITGEAVPVIFTPVAVPIPATLTLTVLNNNLDVGQGAVTLRVLARDASGTPMAGVPVRFLTAPGDEPPDVTGSAFFGGTGFEGQTAANTGLFETSLTLSQAGTVKVTASALGRDGVAILNSNAVDVIFKAGLEGTTKDVATISLITDNPQLGSEGNSEGVIITAIVKNKDNNLVQGAEVSFSADSGEIVPITIEASQATPGLTDVSGRAQARLTTQGNQDNRTIIVTATVPTTTGEPKTDSISIDVVGTTLSLSGPSAVIVNTETSLTISLKNSADKGIGGQTINLTSSLNNTFNTPSPMTDALGQAKVTMIASNAGEDTITASKTGAEKAVLILSISDSNFTVTPISSTNELCTAIDDNEDANNNRILDLGEDLNGNGVLDLGCRVPLQFSEGQRFNIHWDEGGVAQVNEKIILSTTRGQLDKNEAITDFNGDATFTLKPSGDAGDSIVTVRAEKANGPSRQFNLKFVAAQAQSITVQVNPAVIGTNPIGTETEQSEILAVVRDPENNLVFGQRVNFILEDITGGRLTQGSAITDDFGRASTIYIAGPVPSASEGVKITATVVDSSVSASATLTVAKKSLFVTIGSGNKLIKDTETSGTRYNVFHTVLVTDANGTPVSDAEVTLGIYPLFYYKGFAKLEEGKIIFDPERDAFACPNEDINRNGILDPGEDTNNNNQLDPGNVITVDKLNLNTGSNGYADFNMVYAIQYAFWITAEITARLTVSGSESRNVLSVTTGCEAGDGTSGLCPQQNPFGTGPCDSDF